MELKEIKAFVESPAGKSAKEVLQKQLDGLAHIGWIKDLDDPVEIAIELKAQKKAYHVLQYILDVIMNTESYKDPEPKPEEDSLIPGI